MNIHAVNTHLSTIRLLNISIAPRFCSVALALVLAFCSLIQPALAQNASSIALSSAALAPVIQSFSPASVFAGDGDVTLTIRGYGFQRGARVLMSAEPLAVLRVDSASITVRVPAALVARAGLPVLVVRNPDKQEVGARYYVARREIPQTPIIESVSPRIIIATSAPVRVVVTGSRLELIGSASLDGIPILVANVSPTAVTLVMPAGAASKRGNFLLTIAATGGPAASVPFQIMYWDEGFHAIASVKPASNTKKIGTSFTMTIESGVLSTLATVLLVGTQTDTLRVTSANNGGFECIVPASMSSGQYELRVVNPDTQFASQPYGLLAADGKFNPNVGQGIPRASTAANFSLSPNPTTEVMALRAELAAPMRLTVRVLNVLQREVMPSRTEQAQSGIWTTQIDLSMLPRGVYTVELTSSDGSIFPQARQILKQ
jgi:hypothetical protein